MRHVIGKQVIEVNLQGSKNAFALQQTLSQVFWDAVAPAMEALFDKLTPEDELIRIDKLEINLGVLTEQKIATGEWLPMLLETLEVAIKTAVSKKSPGVQVLPLRSGHFEQWLHFLQHGNLPRYISPPPEQEWQQQILEAMGMEVKAVVQLRHVLNTSAHALQRLVLQYPGSFLQHVTELFIGHNAASLHTIFMELKNAWKSIAEVAASPQRRRPMGLEAETSLKTWLNSTLGEKTVANKPNLTPAEWKHIWSRYGARAGREVEVECWKIVLFELSKTTAKPTPNDLLHLVFNQDIFIKTQAALVVLAFEKKTRYPGLKAFFEREGIRPEKKARGKQAPDVVNSPTLDEINQTALLPPPNHLPEKMPTQQPSLEPIPPIENNRTATTDPVPGASLPPEPVSPKTPEQTKLYPTKEEEPLLPGEDGWHIPTAGLVLLHPFLTTFFEKLDLLKDRQFIEEWSRNKAAMLLHFLATGEDTVQEYEMVLPKLLCAIPFNWPLDHSIDLTNEEKFEAEALLQAVLEHWGALGNTTPDGLRGNFLVRDGKLLKTESGWRVQIERKTLDILLDRLPWGIGLVKMPWMPELLMVEWN
jgi:hypothetical protein